MIKLSKLIFYFVHAVRNSVNLKRIDFHLFPNLDSQSNEVDM